MSSAAEANTATSGFPRATELSKLAPPPAPGESWLMAVRTGGRGRDDGGVPPMGTVRVAIPVAAAHRRKRPSTVTSYASAGRRNPA
jgi:hypothetical protein